MVKGQRRHGRTDPIASSGGYTGTGGYEMAETPEVIQGPMALATQEPRALAGVETASAAAAAHARATVEAAYVIAIKRPRDLDQVRDRLMHACRRPSFANEAIYSKPVGSEYNEETQKWEKKTIEDLSIRFAEEAARNLRNLDIDSVTIYDDNEKRIIRFIVADLEDNVHWSKTITVEKRVEKTYLKKGQKAISSRLNSYNKTVYLVDATSDEIQKKESAEGSKAWRTLILKLVPADIKEECRAVCYATMENRAAADPDGEKKKILDGFAALNIQPVNLREYLDDQDLSTLSPKQLVHLRKLYTTIRDGEISWTAVMAQKEEHRQNQEGDAAAAKGKPKNFDEAAARAKEAREKVQAKAEPEKKPDTEKAETPPAEQPAAAVTTAAEAKPIAVGGDAGIQLQLIKSMAQKARVSEDVVAGWFRAPNLADLDPAQFADAIEELRKIIERK